jgi:hypothetical protein
MTDHPFQMHSDAFHSGTPGYCSEITTVRYALRRLGMAVSLARVGNNQQARELCATIIFEMQPIIVARPDLLQATIHALLSAGGFTLLSRLITAMGRREVKVAVSEIATGPIAPPQCRQDAGRTVYELDPRWLHRLLPDDRYLQQWCEGLMAPRRSRTIAPVAAPIEHHLIPA